MPKGADLHAHGGALTPARNLINFVANTKDLLIDTEKNNLGFLKLANKNPGSSYVSLKDALKNDEFTEEELIDL